MNSLRYKINLRLIRLYNRKQKTKRVLERLEQLTRDGVEPHSGTQNDIKK